MFPGLALLCFNHALQVMPIANALAIFFVEPLTLTLLAALVLLESLGLRRLLPVAVGLCGAPIVLRPNLLAYGHAAFFPLATAFLFSCYMLVSRRMFQSGGLLTLQFRTGFFATLALLAELVLSTRALPEVRVYLMPDAREFGLFLLLGLLAGLGHQLIIRALSLIEAGHAAPFQYLEIVSAVTLGWAIFGDVPDLLTWIGAAVIIVAGLLVAREGLRPPQTVDMR